MPDTAESIEQHENNRTRVTLRKFLPGVATGWHRHEMDYVIVPLKSGKLKMLELEGKENLVHLTSGISYFRKAGVEHDVVNVNDYEFAFLEIEFK